MFNPLRKMLSFCPLAGTKEHECFKAKMVVDFPSHLSPSFWAPSFCWPSCESVEHKKLLLLHSKLLGPPANCFIILGMGAAVGFLSGMFGVGGGFLITPLLIFYNVPPAIAVASCCHQSVDGPP